MKREPTPADGKNVESTTWFSPGQSRSVLVNGIEIVVRFVGRKGRRGRICVTAPAESIFVEAEWKKLDCDSGNR